MKDTLNERAIVLLTKMADVEAEMKNINDYDKPSGLCVEYNHIVSDAFTAINSLLLRVGNLRRRIEHYHTTNKNKEEA